MPTTLGKRRGSVAPGSRGRTSLRPRFADAAQLAPLQASGMLRVHSFAPIEDPRVTVLILGSMPGKASLRAGQYYAHPRNLFWRILGELIGANPALPYEKRIRMLKSAGIALWDVLESCTRQSSLDSDIDETALIPNNFVAFFSAHPNITHVFFNGVKAEHCFRNHVQPFIETRSLQYTRLPSSSPANASMGYKQKLEAWRAVIERGLTPAKNV